jgi:DNA topoisomerase VI subunit B
MDREGKFWIISDDGPGIDPDKIPTIFSVNRPLLSSKLKRLPLRGMLGNGLRVVMGAKVLVIWS